MRAIVCCTLLCWAVLFPLSAQNNSGPYGISDVTPALPTFQDQSVLDSLADWEEHITLHTDRESSLEGDMLFFKAYATTGPRRVLFSLSRVLKVDLLTKDRELVSTQYYPITGGTAEGALRVPEKLEPGYYELRAYTRWMQNYGPDNHFSKLIYIGDQEPSRAQGSLTMAARVAYFPEGGRLLAGLQNQLAIEARDVLGCPVAFRGEIVNAGSTERFPVQYYDNGFGAVRFTPKARERYRLKLENGGTYELPEIGETGYVLQVNNLNPDNLRVRILATDDLAQAPVTLMGRSRGRTFLEQKLTPGADGKADIDIPKAGIPAGILDLVLVDAGESTLAHRPVRIAGPPGVRISVTPVAGTLEQEGEASVRIRVTDVAGGPVQSELSIAVVRDQTAPLPNPAPKEVTTRQLRFLSDLQALSHDRGSYNETYPGSIRFPVQRGLELLGYAYDLNNNLLRNTQIQVVGTTNEFLVLQEVVTDASGMLKISDLDIYGETQLIFRTEGAGTRDRLVRIEPLTPKETPESNNEQASETSGKKTDKVLQTTPWTEIDTTGLITLNEAVVEGKKVEEKESPSLYGVKPNRTVYQDPEQPVPTELLLSRIPGVTVTGDLNMNPRITLPMRVVATMAPVLWVVDGLILGNQGMDGHPFGLIPYTDIERIEFVVGPEAAIFGSRGAGGAFLLYTRSGSGMDYIRRKDARLLYKGFEPVLDFRSYLENRSEDRRLRKSNLSTLYWNPNVQTDANGEAVIRFSKQADYGDVRISAFTVTPDGRSGKTVTTLQGTTQ